MHKTDPFVGSVLFFIFFFNSTILGEAMSEKKHSHIWDTDLDVRLFYPCLAPSNKTPYIAERKVPEDCIDHTATDILTEFHDHALAQQHKAIVRDYKENNKSYDDYISKLAVVAKRIEQMIGTEFPCTYIQPTEQNLNGCFEIVTDNLEHLVTRIRQMYAQAFVGFFTSDGKFILLIDNNTYRVVTKKPLDKGIVK